MATKYVVGGIVGIATLWYWAACHNESKRKQEERMANESILDKERQKKLRWKSFKNQDKLITGFCREFMNTHMDDKPAKDIINTLQSYYKMVLEIPWIAQEHKDEKDCCGCGDVEKRVSTMFGFVYFIGLDEMFDQWTNPYLSKKIDLTINPSKMGEWFGTKCDIKDFINVFYADKVKCHTIKSNADNPPYIIIDFKDRFIKPTHYMLKQDSMGNGNLMHWVLQV